MIDRLRHRAGKLPDGCTCGAAGPVPLTPCSLSVQHVHSALTQGGLLDLMIPSGKPQLLPPRGKLPQTESTGPRQRVQLLVPTIPTKGHPRGSSPGTAVRRERHLLWGSAVWPGSPLPHSARGRKRYKPQQSLTQAPTPAGQHTILTSLLRKGLPQAALLSNSTNWAPVRPGLPGHGQASESPHCRGQPPPAWPAGMGWSRANSPHGAPEKGQRSQVLHPHRHREELTLCPQPLPHAGGRGWESSGLWVG